LYKLKTQIDLKSLGNIGILKNKGKTTS